MANPIQSNLIVAQYYAPRGRKRLYELGKELAQRYLYPTDLLIGIIGAEGSGKSTLIQGLFPGLELTNDDDGVNVRRAPIFDFSEDDFFSGHTFHLDARYETAFHQTHQIVEAINAALKHERRVIVEHFDQVYSTLGFNAQLLFSISEEVRVYRPNALGPSPLVIKGEVAASAKYRLMAHSAEDITTQILVRDYHFRQPEFHSDVKHGFVIGFRRKPKFKISELEKKVLAVIKSDVEIKEADGNFIQIGEKDIFCTGKRVHVKSSGEIERFRLVKEFIYDPITKEHLLVGLVGREDLPDMKTFPPMMYSESRK